MRGCVYNSFDVPVNTYMYIYMYVQQYHQCISSAHGNTINVLVVHTAIPSMY